MSPHIFITGATGYIGGTTLNHLLAAYPDLSITAIVRTATEATTLQAAHPSVSTVLGNLDSRSLLMAEAAKADLVLHMANADHEAGTLALVDGMATKNGADKGVFIHTSGSANLLDPITLNDTLGQSAEVYSDIADYERIAAFPSDRWHVAIERKVTAAGEANGIKTIILAPAQIIGPGTGTGKRSTFTNDYIKGAIKLGAAFLINEGQNIWGWSSPADCASAMTFFVSEALKGRKGKLSYGKDGYYFIETGETVKRDQAQFVAKLLKEAGKIDSEELVSIDAGAAAKMHPLGGILWGSSSRPRADKLRALGWQPKDKDWRPLIVAVVKEVLAEN